MKSWCKILLCFLLVTILLSVSIVSCFADSTNFETYKAVDSLSSVLIMFRNTETTAVNLSSVTITDSMWVNLGNSYALDLSAILDACNNINLSLYNYINLMFTFNVGSYLPSDLLVFQSIPGFVISVTGSGESVIVPGTTVNNYSFSLRNQFLYEDTSYYRYDTAAYSAQQISQIKNIYSLAISIQSTSNDENNGYQSFTIQEFVDNGPYLLSFGTSFYYYALAQDVNRYEEGYRHGLNEGTANLNDRVQQAYKDGKDSVLNSSYGQDQYDAGVKYGQSLSNKAEYQRGYDDGLTDAEGFNLSMIPEAYIGTAYNYIVSLFNYDLFGWNILGILGALMVVIVAGFILKKVL